MLHALQACTELVEVKVLDVVGDQRSPLAGGIGQLLLVRCLQQAGFDCRLNIPSTGSGQA
jgi:hypothetical protein